MTDTSILPREAISEQAREAAQKWASAAPGAPQPQCPYPLGSDAAQAWRVAFQRWILRYSAGDSVEGSA